MDLNHLTPDQIASLKTQLAQTDTSGRSPIRARQLHDLRLLPTANDPRPTFFWSAEGSRDTVITHTEFGNGKLMWSEDGVEIFTLSPQGLDRPGPSPNDPAAVDVCPFPHFSGMFSGWAH